MGFFNFIETFFFLSLGITFVLILLLVYHFKQRLTALENKSDTVFEIINNIVHELTAVRQIQTNSMSFRPAFHIPEMNELRSSIVPSIIQNEVIGKIKVLDEDFEEDDESEDSEDASDDDEDDNDDQDEDDEDEEDNDDMPELIDDTTTFEVEDEQATVKIINVPIHETIDSDVLESVELDHDNVNSEDNDRIEPVELKEQDNNVQVEKLEETESLENNQDSDESQKDSKEIYSKMSVSELKALVITKGLNTDPSKKKKHELIKMLDASEN